MRSLSPEMCTSRAPALFTHILFPVCKGKIILLFCFCYFTIIIVVIYFLLLFYIDFFIVIVMIYFVFYHYYYYAVTFYILFALTPFVDEID